MRLYSKLLILLFIFNLSFSSMSQDSTTVKPEDYGKWESLSRWSGNVISDDGNYFAYQVYRNNKKNELRLHHLKSNKIDTLSDSSRPLFSKNNQWFAYAINLPHEKAESMRKSKKRIYNKMGLLNLKTGKRDTIDQVQSFSFSDDSYAIAINHYRSEGQKHSGSDLVVRNLSSQKDFNFGNVSEYAWQDESSLLALIISANNKAGNGIQLYNPRKGTIQVLESDSKEYTRLTWRKKSSDLALFRVEENKDYERDNHSILVWKNLNKSTSNLKEFKFQGRKDFPESKLIEGSSSLLWNKDGSRIFFYTSEWIKKEKVDKDKSKEAPALQIWNSKDVQIIPEQKQIAERNRNQKYLAVWHLNSNKYIELADEHVEQVHFKKDNQILIGMDYSPYENDAMFGRPNADVYKVDVKDGKKSKLLEKLRMVYSQSPDDKYFVYVKSGNYHLFDLSNNKSTNKTEKIAASFVNLDDDHPTEEKFPYRFIGWADDSRSFFVSSKYDIWQIYTSNKNARVITDGEKDRIHYRYEYIDNDRDYIDPDDKMILSMYGPESKKFGYASVKAGDQVKNKLFIDANVSALLKAKNKEKYAFMIQSFEDSPNFYISGSNFAKNEKITNTNPFQKDYAWGKSELVPYTNANGVKLQSALFYPANYDPSKTYPMITYVYEMRSHIVHNYAVPSETNYYNHAVWTQQGYFVLQPDIKFDAGDPGVSSVKSIELAVKSVVDKGLVDASKVGLIGHSWGGYQAAYAASATDIFASVVAGAGLTNLVSMYGMVAWAFGGTPENFHFEVSQERMEVAPWRNKESYLRNSPVMNVMNLNTPLLFEVGDADKNVDWRQGIEYYNAARRENKEMILLVYANEGHGLRQENNRKDYHYRILQWFDHYLKGEEAKEWIKKGIPYTEQQRRLKSGKDL